MRSILLLLLSLIISNKKGCHQRIDDAIVWSRQHKLAYHDFEGSKGSRISNRAYSNIQLQLSYRIDDNGQLNMVKVDAVFFKKKSWFGEPSVAVLLHEQLHFDIGELHARMMRKYLLSISKQHTVVTPSSLRLILDQFSSQMDTMQKEYDAGVASISGYEEWRFKVDNLLNGFSGFN